MRVTIWVLCLALCASTSYAAAPNCNNGDAVGTHSTAPGTSITVSYTRPATCNDCVLLIGVGRRNIGDMTGATVNGNAASDVLAEFGGVTMRGKMFYYLNPPSGTYNVVGTYSTAPSHGHIIAMVCSGVDLSGTPFSNANSASGNSTTPSVTVSSPASTQTLVDFVVTDDSSAVPAAGADQTFTHRGVSGSANAGMSFQAGSVSGGVMSWTIASNLWAIGAVAVNEVPATDAGGGAPIWFH